jgi:hypothetical protein
MMRGKTLKLYRDKALKNSEVAKKKFSEYLRKKPVFGVFFAKRGGAEWLKIV